MSKKSNQRGLSKEQINSVISLYTAGEFSKAIHLAQSLNKDYPNVPLLYNILGVCYKSLGQLETEVRMFQVALNIKGDYSEAHKWYEICAKDIKSSVWTGNLKYYWKTGLHERCTKKKHLLKKNYLNKTEIEESKIFSKQWISTYIN